MKVIKPMSLGFLARPYEHRRQSHLGLAVLGFVPLDRTPALLAETTLWRFLAEELLPEQAIDSGIPKTRAEFLVIGHAYAPAGGTVPAMRVSVRLGDCFKSLNVFGDRYWISNQATEPILFSELPLDWAHAFGGPGFPDNPLGKGQIEAEVSGERRLPLPNIVDPTLGGDALRHAAGFGPTDQTWSARARFAGTYDDRWLKEDFPGFARDIDWRFFNLAPEDQQFAGALAGDEEYAIENMHPEQRLLQGRLPGIAPRVFLIRQDVESFEEVPVALTTVWFFPHRLRMVLVYHGQAALAVEDGSDIARVVLGADRLGNARDPSHFEAVMEKRLDKERGALSATGDSDLVPNELIVPDPALEADQSEMASGGLQQKHARRRMEREIAEKRSYLASLGLDPDKHGPTMPPPEEPLPALEDLPEFVERLTVEADRLKAEQERQQAERDKELDKLLEGSGVTFAQIKAERVTKPTGPPTFTASGKRRELQELAWNCRAMGIDAAHIDEMLADPETTRLWQDAEENFREGYRLSAHLQDPAPRIEAAKSEELRRRLATASPESWAMADLTGADLSGLDLSGRDLEGAWLDSADLSHCNLCNATLINAVLAHVALDGVQLDGADLTGANLGRACLKGASLRSAILRDAMLTGADLENTVLQGADLEGADLSEARLAGIDLSGARAGKMILNKVVISGLVAPGIVLDQAVLLEVDLSGADFSSASCVGTTFLKVVARGANWTDADLSKSCFVEACDLEGALLVRANLTAANLRGSKLAGTDLSYACLDDADFSACDLAGAIMERTSARRTRLVAANLARAVLTRVNFMNAMLARADFRGATLSEVNLYEADAARISVDRNTRTDRMAMTRMRYLPRARP
jgi:uncharacterized protein YjbI with pentapeptide repeats